MTKIHIEIERLILDGLPLDAAQSRIVQTAIENELSRQFSAPEAKPIGTSSNIDHAETAPVSWKSANGPVSLGNQIGNAVSRSIQ